MGLFDKLKSGIKGVAERATGGYGELVVELDQERVKPGEELSFTIKVTAKSPFTITEVTADLKGEERISFSEEIDGKKASAQGRKETVRLLEKISGELEMEEGDTKEFKGTITVPEDAPLTFKNNHCRHLYELEIRIDVPKAKDLTEKTDITVYTEGPAEANQYQEDFLEKGEAFYLKLGAKDISPTPGQELTVSGLIHTSREVSVKSFRMVVESIEELEVKLTEETEEGEQTIGHRIIEWARVQEVMERDPFDLRKSQMDMRHMNVELPGDIQPTFTGSNFKTYTRAVFTVNADDCEETVAMIPITIFGSREGGGD